MNFISYGFPFLYYQNYKNDNSEENSSKEEEKFKYIPFIPSYLSTDNKNEKTTAVRPSPKRKVSKKKISFTEKVVHIDDERGHRLSMKPNANV